MPWSAASETLKPALVFQCNHTQSGDFPDRPIFNVPRNGRP